MCYAVCVKYNGCNDIDIKFDNTGGERLHCKSGDFTRGTLRDYFYPLAWGIGYLGEMYAHNLPKNFSEKDKTRWSDLMRRISCSSSYDSRTSLWGIRFTYKSRTN